MTKKIELQYHRCTMNDIRPFSHSEQFLFSIQNDFVFCSANGKGEQKVRTTLIGCAVSRDFYTPATLGKMVKTTNTHWSAVELIET